MVGSPEEGVGSCPEPVAGALTECCTARDGGLSRRFARRGAADGSGDGAAGGRKGASEAGREAV